MNLVETIQKNLGFQPLQKIDPNTQEVKKPENLSAQDYLPQAAIPLVLTFGIILVLFLHPAGAPNRRELMEPCG